MKAITICQPWAWLIIHGKGHDGRPIKRVENRPWPCTYRGPLAIHAGKSRKWLEALDDPQLRRLVPGLPRAGDPRLVFGAVIGTVELVDCLPVAKLKGDPLAVGPWCHGYANPRALARPVSCAGALSFWQWDQETAEAAELASCPLFATSR